MPDPRKKIRPKTVNEALLDREIRHAVYLLRVGGAEAKWIQSKIGELRKNIVKAISPYITQLETGAALTPEFSSIISQASRAAYEVSQAFFEQAFGEYKDRLVAIAEFEIDYEKALFQKTIPIQRNFAVPSDILVQSAIVTTPIQGKAISQWFKDIPDRTMFLINEEIRAGFLAGESINDILRRVRGRRENGFMDGIIGRQGNQAQSLVRTGVMTASNKARELFHRENQDVIKGFSWVLTLDSRTCPICVAGEGENPYPVDAPPDLPAHVGCRCVKVAVVKSWKELGIDLDEAEPGTRASMAGEVPDTLTYEEWFDMQSEATKEDILGPSRYQAYQKGFPVTAFSDRGQILTLEELRQLEMFPNLN